MATPMLTAAVLVMPASTFWMASSSASPWLPELSGQRWDARAQLAELSIRNMMLGAPELPAPADV